MTDRAERELIRACVQALRDNVPGFKSRRAQMEMIAVVANTISRCRTAAHGERTDGQNLACVEAGTGTGKSYGALVPALVMALAHGKKLVVSSSTVALQQQYALRDVPLLRRILPISFKFAIAKGRRRYACLIRLEHAIADARATAGATAGSTDQKHAARRLDELVDLATRFEDGVWSGDRDELTTPIAADVWNPITNDSRGCSGKHCREAARCPYAVAKAHIEDADLVIANHDLVLASLEGEGGVLPDPAATIYVFDEAHSLPAKAVDRAAVQHPLWATATWIDRAGHAIADTLSGLNLPAQIGVDFAKAATELVQALEALYDQIDGIGAFDDRTVRRFNAGLLPAWIGAHGARVSKAAEALAKNFAQLRGAILERVASHPDAASALATVGDYAGKVDDLVAAWKLLLDTDTTAPVARWVEVRRNGRARDDFAVCAAPIIAAGRLQRLLFDRASAVVVMSATLTSCGNFDLFLGQSGLDAYPGVKFLEVASPFDYAKHADLVVAGMTSDPRDYDAHTAEVVEQLQRRMTTRGTLVLFASKRQMKEVHGRLPEPVRRMILMQGALPKAEMLAEHRAAVERGDTSILFGLQALGEGVDLPGEQCTHVIVVKLPFAVPDSPVEEARREWLEGQGRSAFNEVMLPEMATMLKQWVGRLLRTTDDHGTVTLLDRRLLTARWGQKILRSLPDFRLVVEPRPQR